jgi:competence ComEA-like helix-hairpin-helix protein
MLIFLFLLTVSEDVIFKTEQDIDFELILRDLEYLRTQPLDINTAGVSQFAEISFLSSNAILKIIEYREEHGPFGSVDELSNVPGIGRDLIEMIRPFLTVGVKKVEIRKLNSRFRTRTELPVAERSLEYYTKTEARFGDYDVCVVTEKDPYETDLLDHCAAGLLVDEGERAFALGKYNLDLGAGAVLSPVGSFFRGIDFRIMLNERGLIPFTSTLENGGLFGAAFSDSFFIDYVLFYSNQKLDGLIDSLGYSRSFDDSGEHTDSILLSRKERINEEIFGYDVRYRRADMLIANRSYLCRYGPPFATDDSVTKFYGSDFFITSVEFRHYGELYVVFGEVARSWRNRIGGLFGLSAIFPVFDFTLAGKYFPGGFYSPRGVEVVANHASGTVDIEHHSAIVDAALSMTLDNRLDEDTTKHDLRLSLRKKLGILDARINFRRRYWADDVDLSGSEVFVRLRPVRFLFLDLRFEEKSLYLEETQRGIFMAFEIGLDLKTVDARVRYGMFDTDTYAARIYAYEIDLQGVINNRMLYGDGQCGFVYVAWRPVQEIKLSMKYSVVNRTSDSDRQLGGQIDFNL